MAYEIPTQLLQQNWQELQQRIAAAGIDMQKAGASHSNPELTKLQNVVRLFFMDLAERQPGQIIYGGDEKQALNFTQPLNLRYKTYTSKNQFLAAHRRNGEWAEDVMLFSGLSQLGIQVNYEVRSRYDSCNATYQPYHLQNPIDTITLVNHYNSHWTLGSLPNAGGGNCGFYAVSQAIVQLWPKMMQALGINPAGVTAKPASVFKPQALTTTIQTGPAVIKPLQSEKTVPTAKPAVEVKPKADKTITPTAAQTKTTAVIPASVTKSVQAITHVDALYLTVKNKDHFVETDKQDTARFGQAKTWLNACNLETLVNIYHYACSKLVQDDTYLKRRPHFVAQEYGFDLLRDTLQTGKAENLNTALLAHEELVHMLATECKRNPIAYIELENFVKPRQQSCAKEATATVPPAPVLRHIPIAH